MPGRRSPHTRQRQVANSFRAQPIDPHRPRDVLDALLAHVLEGVGEPVADMVADGARDADAARRRQPLQPRRDVDAVAVNIAAVGDHVAEIDPDAKSEAPLLGEIQIAIDHRALDFAGAAHRVDHARKFREHAVAGCLDDPAVMLADLRIDQFDEMRLEAFVSAFLVGAHQARITHHVGREDRGETAGGARGGHCSGGG